MNFGPHILASLEGTREGLQDAQILWAKVQKQKSYEGQILRMILIFSKPANFGPQGSKTKKLLSDQNLNFGPDFLKTGELSSTCFGIIGKHL